MFTRLSASKSLRSATTLSGTATLDVGVVFADRVGGLGFTFTCTGGTVGTCSATVRGSIDGVTYFDVEAVALPLSGTRYAIPNGPLPRYLRCVLTPAGGFDASVSVTLRADEAYLDGGNVLV